MSAILRLSMLGLLLLGTACGGARVHVRADKADYPISMSEGLRGEDGALLTESQKQSVGGFELDYKAWSALWTLVPISNNDRDISPELNAQIAKAGGDAITGLEITTGHCGWNFFTIVGLFPDCANVYIKGNIVKVPGGPKAAAHDAARESEGAPPRS